MLPTSNRAIYTQCCAVCICKYAIYTVQCTTSIFMGCLRRSSPFMVGWNLAMQLKSCADSLPHSGPLAAHAILRLREEVQFWGLLSVQQHSFLTGTALQLSVRYSRTACQCSSAASSQVQQYTFSSGTAVQLPVRYSSTACQCSSTAFLQVQQYSFPSGTAVQVLHMYCSTAATQVQQFSCHSGYNSTASQVQHRDLTGTEVQFLHNSAPPSHVQQFPHNSAAQLYNCIAFSQVKQHCFLTDAGVPYRYRSTTSCQVKYV